MNLLNKFECLADQAVFTSTKDQVLQSIGLLEQLGDATNQQIRTILSNDSEHFADMSRVAG